MITYQTFWILLGFLFPVYVASFLKLIYSEAGMSVDVYGSLKVDNSRLDTTGGVVCCVDSMGEA